MVERALSGGGGTDICNLISVIFYVINRKLKIAIIRLINGTKMKSKTYDPPSPGDKAPPHPGYPPQQPYYQYPGYPPQYPYPYHPPGPKKSDSKLILVIVAVVVVVIIIPIILAGVLYIWVTSLSDPYDNHVETIVADLNQGDGNMTSGCLFTLRKGSGESVLIEDYRFRVWERGRTSVYLEWPSDGNNTASGIDSSIKNDDELWWDQTEIIGFDAPTGLTGIEDGDRIEVEIINMAYGEVVFSSSFTYRD